MNPYYTSRILAIRTSLAAETRSIGSIANGEVFIGKYLITVDIGNRDFRRGYEEEVVCGSPVHILFQFR